MQFIFRRLVALCGDFRATLNGDPFRKRCERYGALAGRYAMDISQRAEPGMLSFRIFRYGPGKT